MADHNVGASVVVVDAKAAAEQRNRHAHEQLSDALPEQRALITLRGLRMTVPYSFKVVSAAKEEAASRTKALAILEKCFAETDKHLNNYNPNSEISAINRCEDISNGIKVSPTLGRVLAAVFEISRSSGGSFDPATAPICEYLREHRNRPLSEAQTTALAAIGQYGTLLNGFRLQANGAELLKCHPKARMDLGGISKGFTVDRVIEECAAAGLTDVFFDWGGDCRATGRNASRQLWSVGIVRPPALGDLLKARPDEPQLLGVLTLDNEALATSGDYENLIRDGSVPSTTTFDPRLGDFVTPDDLHLASVSIKATSCMHADALATASFTKRDISRVRFFLDNWRFAKSAVVDYFAYIRKGEVVARMHEIAKESDELRQKRISGSLPARVVVVGGGLAGLSAALEAAACNAHVVIIEKEKIGGNSAKATSGINGWGTRAQGERGIQDSGKYFERDTHFSGKGGSTDTSLVKMLSVKSGEAVHWLGKRFGIPLSVISQLGGHSRPRTHRAPDQADGTPVPIGYTIMKHMEQNARNSPRITIMTGYEVRELISHSEEIFDGSQRIFVSGVRYAKVGDTDPNAVVSLQADAVVLATGGFGSDRDDSNSLMREFAPKLFNRPTTNGAFATGDGVKMARKVGARLVDMDKVQLHPTGFIDPKQPANPTKFLGPEALRGSGGILVNTRGQRFVNELDLRSAVSNAIIKDGQVYPDSNGCFFAWCILNEAAAKLFGPHALGFYMARQGLFQKAQDVEALAKIIGCPVATLTATLTAYRQASQAKAPCPATGKLVFPCVIGTEGPFYAAIVTPTIHYTMGGALITPSAEILSNYKSQSVFGGRRPIYGLFGAGEVTGGVHGRNRLGGNSLLECVVFGRIAGDRAATILQRDKTALSFTSWTSVVVREIREGGQFGHGSRVLRFNLPGALQQSGLKLGQFIAIRGEWDGQQLIGYYSPVTLPDDLGVIGILARVDKGSLKEWVNALRPGDAVEMRAFGGLVIDRVPSQGLFTFNGQPIRQIAMIAGGTGIAPMLQIIRAALKHPFIDTIASLRLVYAAEEMEELTYKDILCSFATASRGKFKCHFVLNTPPPGWTDGVGFIDKPVLTHHVQMPANDLLVVICGPPVMQNIVKSTLFGLGHCPSRVRTVDETEPIGPKSKL